MKAKKRIEMIEAMRKSLGNITIACRNVGITRLTHYEWLKKYPEYAKEIDDVKEEEIDWVENALRKNIGKGDTTSMIFFLKTRAKHRGYIERSEIIQNTNTVLPTIQTLAQICEDIKHEKTINGTGNRTDKEELKEL